jgi:hypothetical protein
LVRLAKEEYKKNLTSQLTDTTICLRILGATPSGPLGLVQFKISSWSFTSSSVIKKSGQVFTPVVQMVLHQGFLDMYLNPSTSP